MIYGTPHNAKESTATPDDTPQTRLSCLIEGRSPVQRDRHRVETLTRLNLLGNDTVPVFEEATQNISRLLAMPICILSVMDTDVQRFKSVVGLSSLGLMNQLAAARMLPKKESFCTHVIDSSKTFILPDATAHAAFSCSLLVQQYGIQSYLGVPLITTEGCCIGTLAVMDLMPHQFTQQEVAFLELSARWCMSEFEKQQALQARQQDISAALKSAAAGDASAETSAETSAENSAENSVKSSLLSRVNQVRFDLIVQLTQDLRNPLTSITGMASMLSREIYGPLSEKQQEYAKIVLSSSQQLLSMVNEIVEISDLQAEDYQLSVTAADIEMLGQQALAALASIAKQQDLQLKLTVEPGSRIWNLDKRVVKQLIYHLVFSVVKMSTAGSTIRLHVSRKNNGASIALWVSNPWLGEDLPQAIIAWNRNQVASAKGDTQQLSSHQVTESLRPKDAPHDAVAEPGIAEFSLSQGEAFKALATAQKVDASRQALGLLLSRHLIEVHGGEASVQGSAASGYRYIITLPSLPLSQQLQRPPLG